MRSRTLLALVALTIGAVVGWPTPSSLLGIEARAREEAPRKPAAESSPRTADERAIREAARDFARAFERGDAQAVAAFWTEQGEYESEDREPLHGREALAKAYADFLAKNPRLKIQARTDSVRFLGEDTAIEEGTFTVQADDAPPDSSHYRTLYAREGGRWLIARLEEWRDEGADWPSLDDLAWLIGTWKAEGEELQARVSYEWTEGKSFIRNRFEIKTRTGDAPVQAGVQIIGVDPAEGILRAWTFDPDGGFGEATWTWDGRRWAIDSEGVLASGSRTTALNFLIRDDADSFTWRSVRRTLDGEDAPNVKPLKVHRVREGK